MTTEEPAAALKVLCENTVQAHSIKSIFAKSKMLFKKSSKSYPAGLVMLEDGSDFQVDIGESITIFKGSCPGDALYHFLMWAKVFAVPLKGKTLISLLE